SAGNTTRKISFPQDSAPFELRLLGPFTLTHLPSDTLIPVTAAKMRALFALLCASPGFTEKRRRVAGLLWASRGDDQARHSLRQLLSQFK
uniref:AfsR/SARP family transcriptional regulator n=1 Tax=Stenotrophomonas indicatrix TaxID=2045451 RepID=UPI001968252C